MLGLVGFSAIQDSLVNVNQVMFLIATDTFHRARPLNLNLIVMVRRDMIDH